MPSASAKLEKQASTEAVEPIKQGITIIEHKIRNLEKRKARLETYRDQQSSGKELNSDQLGAIAKYDEVMQTLEFARDLNKQFHTIATDTARLQKKQAKKEALEKTQQELGKIKEILLIQDVLANMGHDSVREDFLAGRNGAVKLTEEDLQHLDDLFTEVSPKREVEEGGVSFPEQIQKAAEHLLLLAEGKNKDVIGTTYAQLRQKIHDIHSCGYFESSSSVGVAVTAEGITDAVSAVQAEEEDLEGDDEEPESVPTATFQSSKTLLQAPTAQVIKNESNDQGSTIVIPPQQPVSEVISSVMSVANSSFHFLQDSELDSPDVTLPIAPPASALPIPTQTFTNQNFVPPPQSYQQQQQQPQPPPPQQVPPPTQSQTQQPQPVYSAMTITGHGQQPSYATFTSTTAAAPPPPQHQAATYQQPQPPAQPIQQPSVVDHVTHWSDATSASVLDSSDWCDVSTASDNARQQKHHQSQSQADSWANETHHGNNDDFVLAGGRGGSSRGRGGGRGGPRGGSRGGNRNSSGGGNYYRNNNNNSGGDNYYQSNGYPKRGGGGGGGPGGPRIGSGGPRSDRGGPRGGGNRGGGRGGNRQ